MENENKNGGSILANKTELIKMFMFILCLVFVLLLVYIVGGLLLNRNSFYNANDKIASEADAYFKDCSILEGNCTDTDCGFYSLCDGHKTCRIYDCGKEYGVYAIDIKDKLNAKKVAKPDMEAIEAKKAACKGSMEILEQNCVDGKTKLKAKITTKGECKIDQFTLYYEGIGAQSGTFSSAEGGIYEITSNICGQLSSIVPAAEGGIALEF